MIALRDGIAVRDALDRLDVDTTLLDVPPPPGALMFEHVPPGTAFTWQGHVWTRATLDQALAATPDRRAHARVVAAYLAASQRRQPATAFRWSAGPVEACHAEYVGPEEAVVPAQTPAASAAPPPAWVSMADRTPDPGRAVTIDTASGPVAARLVLDDYAPDGALWRTAGGESLDLDEVSRWRP